MDQPQRTPSSSPHVPPVRHSIGLLFLYGALDGHPFSPSHVASGRCVLSAAAAGAPAGVVAAFGAQWSVCRGCTGCGGMCRRWRFTTCPEGGLVLTSKENTVE